jgi:hypothetical protein
MLVVEKPESAPCQTVLWIELMRIKTELKGFHGGDYEECRLLGYKNPVRTPQEILRPRYRAQPVNAV